MIGRSLDKLIGLFSPLRALQRTQARATMDQITAFTGGQSGYEAGKLNRFTKGSQPGNASENTLPRAMVDRVKWKSADLFRNNPHARKIVRTLQAKVVGRGLVPMSRATTADDKPDAEFRKRAGELWEAVSGQIDYRGKPGFGGQHFGGLQQLALLKNIIGGEILYRLISRSPEEQADLGLEIPFQLQLIDGERLVGDQNISALDVEEGNEVSLGVELRPDGTRAAYHILDKHPSGGSTFTRRISAQQIGHLFVSDDIDQLRGVPWFAASLTNIRDTADYQFNELKASAIAACVTLGVRRPSGASKFGVDQPEGWSLTDADGNALTAMQPGMIVDLGQDGALEGFDPGRPGNNTEPFIQHLTRTSAVGLPGVKASTLTGDYRGASFSSERSADNDAWPELEVVQDWFALGFCQPIYEAVIRAGMLSGWFEGVVSATEFNEREKDFLAVRWQGPVAKTINPMDEAKAADMRIANGSSTPQKEAAALATDWRQNLRDLKEYMEFGAELGLPEELVKQHLGINENILADVLSVEADAATKETDNGKQRPAGKTKANASV